jgi:hypothetical protein
VFLRFPEELELLRERTSVFRQKSLHPSPMYDTRPRQQRESKPALQTGFEGNSIEETTLSFWQEIYNENGILVEYHEKYPVNMGHKKIEKR